MPTFMALGLDREPLDPARRDAHRAAHREYLTKKEADIISASAVFNDRREVAGSIYFLAARDKAEVEQWLADDPFVNQGLYQSWTIMEVYDRGDWWALPRPE